MKITITKNGIRKFIDNCVSNIVTMVGNIDFQDYYTEFADFKIQVRDIEFSSIAVGDYEINLDPHVSSVGIRDTNFVATFVMDMQQ